MKVWKILSEAWKILAGATVEWLVLVAFILIGGAAFSMVVDHFGLWGTVWVLLALLFVVCIFLQVKAVRAAGE